MMSVIISLTNQVVLLPMIALAGSAVPAILYFENCSNSIETDAPDRSSAATDPTAPAP